MVEVFKTNVNKAEDAQKIIRQIHQDFEYYQVNFDLDDCDRILRVQCLDGFIASTQLISILQENGFDAIILADDFQPAAGFSHDFSVPSGVSKI
ncbi:MAG: hypothetical protein V4541_12545 [Bacteroidota bacterium]